MVQQVAGRIYILRVDPAKTPAIAAYRVMFAPSTGGGGALPDRRIEGDGGPRAFLNDVGIHEDIIEDAVTALRQAPCEHQIPHVLLTPARIQQLGSNARGA